MVIFLSRRCELDVVVVQEVVKFFQSVRLGHELVVNPPERFAVGRSV